MYYMFKYSMIKLFKNANKDKLADEMQINFPHVKKIWSDKNGLCCPEFFL